MLKSKCVSALAGVVFVVLSPISRAPAAQAAVAAVQHTPEVAPASADGELALKRFRVPKGFKVELFAAEPMLANPVAFCIDEQGRFYVAETFRLHAGVTDIRGHMNWLDDDLASQSVEDRVAMMRKYEGANIANYTRESERVRLIVDVNGDGKADKAAVFAEGFNTIADGIGAGLLARKGNIYYANIPRLWLLRDNNGDGVADVKNPLHDGYGVRVGFLGHDLHGLRFGPDGKLYFSIGDRAFNVKSGGHTVKDTETGAVLRCNPDGSELEIFARGLRNPQELVFDQYGNLWTGDNNSDGGDPARWVYVVEGGDSGWRIGYQFLNAPNPRGVWLGERMCYPPWAGQAAFIVPPIANIANGPSGLAYYPGAGFPDQYQEHFFLCDFHGGISSGIHSFAMKPKGASFELVDRKEFIWEVLVTDGDFGYDGSFYLADWVKGWNKTGKGRIYRIYNPESIWNPVVGETKRLIAEGFDKRSITELIGLLAHTDMRVRQEAQFALVDQALGALDKHYPPEVERILGRLTQVAAGHNNLLARLHALWAFGQIGRKHPARMQPVLSLLADPDPEVRAQSAKVLGDAKALAAFDGLMKLLADAKERPRFFAAIALGKLGRKESIGALIEMLRTNDNQDPYLRHAGVIGLVGCADAGRLQNLAKDKSASVRLAAVVALRRLERSETAAFLHDDDPLVVAEAARAINDLPISTALPQLALRIRDTGQFARLPAGTKQAPGPRDAILRRVLNANFRLGGPINAGALADFAANSAAPEALRIEALQMLGAWAKPSGRDRISGLWRPLPPRDAKAAGTTLQSHLAGLLRSPIDSVKVAATRAAGQLGIQTSITGAYDLVQDTQQPVPVRLEAMRSLVALQDAHLADALKLALADNDLSLRKEAIRIQAQTQPKEAPARLRAVLEKGSLGEQQTALTALGDLPGNAGDEILAQWLDKLLAKQVPPELQLDVIEASAKRTTPLVQEKLKNYAAARAGNDPLAAYREVLYGGDAEEGKRIFYERAEASCFRCHQINSEGGEVGPPLTGIGAKQTREYLLESIVTPNARIAPGFESVLAVMNNGTTYAGVVKGEDAGELVLHSLEDGVLKLKKSDIKSRATGQSGMPEGLGTILTKQDLRDVIEFLENLK